MRNNYVDFARQLLRKLYGKSGLAECTLSPNHPRFFISVSYSTRDGASYKKLLCPNLPDFLIDERKRHRKEEAKTIAENISKLERSVTLRYSGSMFDFRERPFLTIFCLFQKKNSKSWLTMPCISCTFSSSSCTRFQSSLVWISLFASAIVLCQNPYRFTCSVILLVLRCANDHGYHTVITHSLLRHS